MCASLTATDLIAHQQRLLPGVSRTFALTIPQLPEALRPAITNAYLLCRTADVIEDSSGLSVDQKRRYYQGMIAVLDGHEPASAFAAGLLRDGTIALAQERELIERVPAVIAVYRSLPGAQRLALLHCLRTMSEGMARFEGLKGPQGLADRRQFREYCYVVAGVVGEMLTELFALQDGHIARRREALLPLARAFGQGLQMTNILKDLWDDRRRGVCYLPRDLLAEHGCDLAPGADWAADAGFRRAMRTLIAVAHQQLQRARDYTLAVPRQQAGIRRFCSWAIGLALYTLRNIHDRPDYRCGTEVKVSRARLRLVTAGGHLAVGSNGLLRAGFALAANGLPTPSEAQLCDLAAERWRP